MPRRTVRVTINETSVYKKNVTDVHVSFFNKFFACITCMKISLKANWSVIPQNDE